MDITNITTITILCLLVLVPYFAIMGTIAGISYISKLRSVITDFKKYATTRSNSSKSNLPRGLKIYIACMIFLLMFVICLIILSIGYYLKIPWILDTVNGSLLGKIIIGAFIIVAIIIIPISLLYDRLFKKRE